jgi:demethylmenaquinone methyltransferase / 2-methoxy-6-polyprenyl-1,4-benzoquinol methylase
MATYYRISRPTLNGRNRIGVAATGGRTAMSRDGGVPAAMIHAMTPLPGIPSNVFTRDQSGSPAWTTTDLRANPHAAPDKAARVQRMFAAIARKYDLNNRLHSFGRDVAWRKKAVQLCDVRSSDRVLDVACGTGDLTQAFAAANPASVTGLDFTNEMLDIARHKAQRHASAFRGALPNYVQGDAMALPFADASFDIVSIAFGIRNVSDPTKALREFHRVLTPSGRLVVLEFTEPRNRLIAGLNRVYTTRIMPITATVIARDRSGAYRYLPQSVATFYGTNEFADLVASCGFHRPQIRPMTFGVCTAYLAKRAL